MAGPTRVICRSEALAERGAGVRFEVRYRGELAAAFAVRFEGQVHAYLNRCSHVAMELDWRPGAFFDSEGGDLICSTHGAVFAADSGRCMGGPCSGGPLVKLTVRELGGEVLIEEIPDG